MSCLEHLIENCLCDIEEGKSPKEVIENIKKDVNLKYADITPSQCWEICQYVYYTFIMGHYRKIEDSEYD